MTMTSSFRKTISIILMLCMAAFVFCGTATDAHAASKYKKSFTKTVTVKPGKKCQITMDVKAPAKVEATATTTAKKQDIHSVLNLKGAQKEGFQRKAVSVKKSVSKGKCTVTIGNAGSKAMKFKVKVSSVDKKAVLQYKSKKMKTLDDLA